jgi:putative hemolysin
MEGFIEYGLPLTIAAVLIALNALYVFHEFAYVSISPTQLKRIEMSDSRVAQLVARGVNNLDHYIAVDQLGITATSIGVGWIGQPALVALFGEPLDALGISGGAVTVVIAIVAFCLIIGIQMVLGELVPKTVALRHAERVAFIVAVPIEITARLLHPAIFVLNGVGTALVRLLGFKPDGEGHGGGLSSEELSAIVERSARAGLTTADPRALRMVMHFSEVETRDIMIPRHAIVGIELGASLDDVLATGRVHKHARYPVFDGSIDRVVGLLNVKELVQISDTGEASVVEDWEPLMRPIPALPSSASVEKLLQHLRRTRQEMALLINEYGETDGIATVTGVARYFVGEAEGVRRTGPGQYVLQGQLGLMAVDTALGLSLDEEFPGVATIGGLVMDSLGRIPGVGDRIDLGRVSLQVTAMDDRRVSEIVLQISQ